LVEVTYRSPSSGAVVRFPVQYVKVADDVIAMPGHAEGKRWWRAFRSPRAVRLRLPEGERAATGLIVAGSDRFECLDAYLRRFPSARRVLGLENGFTPADVMKAAERSVLVRFRPDETGGDGSERAGVLRAIDDED